jgi:hypothetical protein
MCHICALYVHVLKELYILFTYFDAISTVYGELIQQKSIQTIGFYNS